MATTPQLVILQNSVWIEFAHTHLHTTPSSVISGFRSYETYPILSRTYNTVSLKHDGIDRTDGTVKWPVCLSRLCLTDGIGRRSAADRTLKMARLPVPYMEHW